MTNIKDVAKLAGVSHASVSKVINNKSGISDDTRKKILDAIEKLNYIPNESARRMRNKPAVKNKNIGCINCIEGFRKYSHPARTKVLEGIDQETIRQGYHLYFNFTAEELNSNPVLFEKITPETIDGVIINGGVSETDARLIEKIRTRTRNIVIAAPSLSHPILAELDRIDSNPRKAAYLAVWHLADLGHKRIAYIGTYAAPAKINGYEDALKEMGLSVDPSLVEHKPVAGNQRAEETGYEYIKAILDRAGQPPTAVFAETDQFAIGAMKAIGERGLKIPDNISIASMDNIDSSAYTVPPLTTVDINLTDIGRHAVKRLVERSQTPGLETSIYTIEPRLIIRSSSVKPA